jgi:hypothetical protein
MTWTSAAWWSALLSFSEFSDAWISAELSPAEALSPLSCSVASSSALRVHLNMSELNRKLAVRLVLNLSFCFWLVDYTKIIIGALIK